MKLVTVLLFGVVIITSALRTTSNNTEGQIFAIPQGEDEEIHWTRDGRTKLSYRGDCKCGLYDRQSPFISSKRHRAIIETAARRFVTCYNTLAVCKMYCNDMLDVDRRRALNDLCNRSGDTTSIGFSVYAYARLCEETDYAFTKMLTRKLCCRGKSPIECHLLKVAEQSVEKDEEESPPSTLSTPPSSPSPPMSSRAEVHIIPMFTTMMPQTDLVKNLDYDADTDFEDMGTSMDGVMDTDIESNVNRNPNAFSNVGIANNNRDAYTGNNAYSDSMMNNADGEIINRDMAYVDYDQTTDFNMNYDPNFEYDYQLETATRFKSIDELMAERDYSYDYDPEHPELFVPNPPQPWFGV